MVITELKEGKRNPSHIHVSVDGEYAFTTSIDLVARYHLKEGAALTGEQMQELLGEALLGQAKERALSLLSYRAYSRRELVKKLRERVPEEIAEAAADRMEELGYLDDADYAARYASDLYHLKRKSLSHIRQALRLRGIDGEIMEQVLEPYEEEDEQGQILRVIEKKYRRRLEEDWEKNRPKVVAALMRLGFSYGDIKQALEEYGEDEDDGF